MTPPGTQRRHASWVFEAVLLCTAAALAQQPGASQGKFAAATLPESNEALLYSSRVEEAIQAGDYRLAVELIERLIDLPPGLVAAPASRNYYPVWRQAFRLQGHLPEAGVELYRQLHDAEVDARFGQAAAEADLRTLRELFHGYRLSTAWPAIGAELVAHLLDQGAYGEAIEVLRELTPRADRPWTGDGAAGIPEQRAQLVVALAGAGAFGPARLLLDELRVELGPDARSDWAKRLEELERWVAALQGEKPGLTAEAREPLTPCIEAGPVWRQPLIADDRAYTSDSATDIADAASVLRRLPLHQAVLAEDLLVVRLHRRLWALDPRTLLLRWNVSERLANLSEGRSTGVAAAAVDEDLRLSPDAVSLLSDHLGHVVSAGFGKVYAIERLGSFETDLGMFGRRPFPAAREMSTRNELVARELESGRIVWRTMEEAASPLYDAVFQNVPIVVANSLVAPIRRGDELSLAVIDPADGSLIREVPLVGPPTYFTGEGGRCLIVSDPTTLYVCTGNGVIAALARNDLSWKWAAVYPSTLAQHLTQWWWQPIETTVEPNIDPPLIADDLLIVAPVDSPDMFALDRFDGRERWRMSRREYPYLIGTLPGAVVVAGREVACLELNNPASPALWKSVPLRTTGRAVIRDGRIFVPTRDGIVVLDGRSGKVLADQTDAAGPRANRDDRLETDPSTATSASVVAGGAVPDCTANLLVAGDTLFSVSPSRVVKYPDLVRAGARYAGQAEGTIDRETEELVRAWLDALDGRYDAAFARLQACSFDDPRLATARDQLLTHVFLGLAEDAAAGEDRLTWLQRASALADSPEAAADLAITIGRALEGSGEWAAALRHYGQVLRQPEVGYVTDRTDPGRRVAGWLHAAERIDQARAMAPQGALPALVDQALSSDDRRAENLQRLLIALADGPERDRVAQLLTLQKLAPELKVRCLPDAAGTDLPVGLRRRLHLERWDTHVSLGWLAEASADRAVWDAQFANAPTPDAAEPELIGYEQLSADEQRDRVDAIGLAFRKLAQIQDEPFRPGVTRQWKIERAELLLDPRRPLAASCPWILVADLAQHKIALINAFKHQHPQRQTEDRMLTTGIETDAGEPYGRAIEGRRFEWEGGRRTAWPAVLHQQLAAIPVRGGLICVGLGPERYAGRRQWGYAVPEWAVVPAGFTDQSVAGTHGVYFTPRCDRVALVGWFDGQLWWQRELPGVTIQRLHIIDEPPNRDPAAAGELLVIVDENQRVWVTDATFGRRLQSVETTVAAPQRVDVVGGTILVWGLASAAGIDAGTLEQIWQREFPLVADTLIVAAARVDARDSVHRSPPWIAHRTHGRSDWHLLDARDGQPVFEASLGEYDAVAAIVADAERILVAGSAGVPAAEGEQRCVRLSAHGLADGQQQWSRDFAGAVDVNATQLAAHPDVIPILLASGGGESTDAELPAIQLVSKHDGQAGQSLSIKGDFRPAAEATCEMYMLVTPTRMIVQAGGNLIAYGNSPLQPGP